MSYGLVSKGKSRGRPADEGGTGNTSSIDLELNARHLDVLLMTIKIYKYRQNKTDLLYYTLPLPGYMFRLLRVIIRPSNELTQDYLIPSALWDPVALTIAGATVLWVHVCYYST